MSATSPQTPRRTPHQSPLQQRRVSARKHIRTDYNLRGLADRRRLPVSQSAPTTACGIRRRMPKV